MGQTLCISLSRLLSTQAMLLAVGIGHGGALPMAAVINWILKDGIGHLGSIIVGTTINTKFDSDPKRYKFLSVFLGQSANLLGILSLAKPTLFLLLTSFSSAISRVGTLAFTSSRARIYENFAREGNLGDLMRASQSQATLATILGTAIGVSLAPIIGSDIYNLILVFSPLTVLTHYLAYKAVATLELRSLNRQRFELVMDEWLKSGTIPLVAEVAKKEQFIRRPVLFPVQINPDIDTFIVTESALKSLESDLYVVNGKTVYISDKASAVTVLRAMFEACGGSLSDWEKFQQHLIVAGWDISIAFIDDIDRRVFIT